MRFLLLFFSLLFIGCLNTASANIVLNKIIVNFDAGGSSREDVEVWNNSNTETMYVSSTVYKVNNPENEKMEKIEQTDLLTSDLIVSPSKIILKPNERKIMRLITRTTAKDKDIVYRVKIAPSAGELDVSDVEKGKKAAGVKILIGYEMLIFMRPPQPHDDLKVTRSGKMATFTNAGNSNVDLREVTVCNDDKTECQPIKAKRLYAGQTWTTELPRADGIIHVSKSVGMEFSEQDF
jgi:P pilus assembly chaperone PapD